MQTQAQEAPDMARINLSIPDDLKATMDALDLNWSQVAADAFRNTVQLAQLKETDMDDAALIRLRDERNQHLDRQTAKGEARGKQWALHKASYEQLEAVAALADGRDAYEFDGLAAVYRALSDYYGHPHEIDEEVFQMNRPSEAFADGFITGAAEVFDEV